MVDLGTALSAAQTLFAALECSLLKEAYSVSKYKSDFERLKRTVTTVQSVLADAGKKATLSQADMNYIQKLKDAVYDADDLFDKFITIAARKQNDDLSDKGFVMNMQPSEAEAGIDIRVPPTADQAALENCIAEEWAPASRNMTFEFKQKGSVLDKFGKPALTVADSSNPWWTLLEEAVLNAGGKLGKPDILFGTTDARFFRQQGLPAIGFSPIANTPLLLHDHNEFLNEAEYMKGVDVYASIIKAYASISEPLEEAKGLKDEL